MLTYASSFEIEVEVEVEVEIEVEVYSSNRSRLANTFLGLFNFIVSPNC